MADQDVLPAEQVSNTRKGPRAKAGPTASRAALVRQQILQLSRSGMKCPAIGQALGITPRHAYQSLKKSLREVSEENFQTAVELRDQQLDRLDALLFGVWGRALKGEVQAVDRALKILERMDRLRGLDAPIRLMVQPEDDLASRVARAAGAGMPHNEIALALGLSLDQLEQQFGSELSHGVYRRRMEVYVAMQQAAAGGNVAAAKAYAALQQQSGVMALEPPGKKAQAEATAKVAQAGTKWEGVLPHSGALQ